MGLVTVCEPFQLPPPCQPRPLESYSPAPFPWNIRVGSVRIFTVFCPSTYLLQLPPGTSCEKSEDRLSIWELFPSVASQSHLLFLRQSFWKAQLNWLEICNIYYIACKRFDLEYELLVYKRMSKGNEMWGCYCLPCCSLTKHGWGRSHYWSLSTQDYLSHRWGKRKRAFNIADTSKGRWAVLRAVIYRFKTLVQ